MIETSTPRQAAAVGAYAVFTRTTWAWLAAIVAHVFALAGVLLGMWAIASGFGPHSVLCTSNDG